VTFRLSQDGPSDSPKQEEIAKKKIEKKPLKKSTLPQTMGRKNKTGEKQ